MEGDEKLERLLRENLKVAKENNRRLRDIQRSMFLGGVIRLLVWAVILGLPFIIYFTVLKPYVDSATELYEGIGSGETNILDNLNFINLEGVQNTFEESIR